MSRNESKLDTSDPGKAANVAARAAMLYARTCGLNAFNAMRAQNGMSPGYLDNSYDDLVHEFFPEWNDDHRTDT